MMQRLARQLPVLLALSVIARTSNATIIIAVPAVDGLMVCADRFKSVPGARKATRVNKLHRLGPRFAWAVAGHVRLVNRAAKAKALDAEAFVGQFFEEHPPEPSADLFEAFDSFLQNKVANDLRTYFGDAPPIAALNLEVVFFWIDDANLPHVHSAKLWRSPAVVPSDTSSRPNDDGASAWVVVGGTGREVLQALVDSDPRLDAVRRDEPALDLLRGSVRVKDLDLRVARRRLKRLIVVASRAEPRVRAEHTMTEESDCLALRRRPRE